MGFGGGCLRVPVRSVHEADPSPAWDRCGAAFWCRGPHGGCVWARDRPALWGRLGECNSCPQSPRGPKYLQAQEEFTAVVL